MLERTIYGILGIFRREGEMADGGQKRKLELDMLFNHF
jgi:hypothetical protein